MKGSPEVIEIDGTDSEVDADDSDPPHPLQTREGRRILEQRESDDR